MSALLEATVKVTRGNFVLDVDFTAEREVVAVLGPNGAGKSTLLSALAGHTALQSGRIALDGQVLDDASTGVFVEPAQRSVGVVFQDYRLFPHLSVLDNVSFAARSRGAGKSASHAAAQPWLERMGIGDLAKRRPSELSGGQAQRVALARALAGEPGLLLLDEPLAALDARTRMDVQSELRAHLAAFDGPCLLVTHDPVEALVLADRLLVVEGGRIVQAGTPAEVTRQPATEYVARLVGLNLYSGHCSGRQVEVEGGGTLVVPDDGLVGDVLVAMRPSSVVVHTSRPEPSSARNVWEARIDGMTMLADRVRLDLLGQPSAIVDVTPSAASELGLVAGRSVWLSAKATELEVYARP